MKRVTVILIAVCIAAFLGVASLGVQFMNTGNILESKEGFKSVTRASDCNCLPGYIPKSRDDNYFCSNLTNPTKTRECY